MILQAAWISAVLASASPAPAVERPVLDVSLEPGLGLYVGQGLPARCENSGCAAGPSLAAQLGARVTPMIDVIAGWRHVWSSDRPNRIDEPALGVALWPSPVQTFLAARVYATLGPILIPDHVGFEARVGGEFILFPARWGGAGIAGEVGLGLLRGSGIGSLHVGAVFHFRL